MTTFTITCPPTQAAATWVSKYSATGSSVAVSDVDSSFESSTHNRSEAITTQINESSDTFFSASNTGSEIRFYPEDYGGGNGYFWTNSAYETDIVEITQRWDGGRTFVGNYTYQFNGLPASDWNDTTVIQDTTSVWTSFTDTSSQTTTTQTETVYTTTFTDTTQITTLSGTMVQTGSMIAPEPRTTVTQTEGFTTKTANLETTRITLTTHEDTFAKWRTGEGGETHRGTWQEATVVCLETFNLGNLRPEMAWIVTHRPSFTETSTEAIEQQTVAQFTVLPSFVTTAGHVEQATYDTSIEDFVVSASSETVETPTTYTTTTQTGNTATLASQFTAIPSPLSQQVGTTISTQEWFSTIVESRFTGGDTSTTTIFSTTTHEGRIGSITWNATHRRSTTAKTSFDFSSSYTFATSENFTTTVSVTGDINGDSGLSQTVDATFQRPVSVLASIHAHSATQNQCGSSLSFAVAVASNLTSAAQEIGAAGVSVAFPVLVNAAQTARVPLGSWSYVTAGTTVSASAGPASLSVTSRYGPSSGLSAQSTTGAWTVSGQAVSRANLPTGQRINLGGVAPTGTATAFYDAGVFSTSDGDTSGTTEVTQARTEIIDPTAARTAYLLASGVFISGGQRYNTAARNITQTIAESAIITNRTQLIL